MLLEIQDISKSYSKKGTVLDHISFQMREGIYGLLGPNGAGKTTLMNIMTANLQPDGGCVMYNGEDIKKQGKQYRASLGYAPQQQWLYDDFRVTEYLHYMASLKNVPRREQRTRIDELLEQMNLEYARHQKIKTLSGGMKQRLLIAQALLNDPEVLLLDEPTAGLDPKERIGIRNYIAELSRDKIILFATHVVSDIECIADKVLLLKDGEIIATGTPSQLIENMQGKVGEVVCTLSDVADLQGKYHIGNIRQRKNGMVLRLVGDELPEEAVRVDNDIDLEDVYLYYFE